MDEMNIESIIREMEKIEMLKDMKKQIEEEVFLIINMTRNYYNTPNALEYQSLSHPLSYLTFVKIIIYNKSLIIIFHLNFLI